MCVTRLSEKSTEERGPHSPCAVFPWPCHLSRLCPAPSPTDPAPPALPAGDWAGVVFDHMPWRSTGTSILRALDDIQVRGA